MKRVIGKRMSSTGFGNDWNEQALQSPTLDSNIIKICDPLTPRQIPQTQITHRPSGNQTVCKTQRDTFPRSSTGYLKQIPDGDAA